jgi:hypothetical protein
MEKCKCQPIENQESENLPIAGKEKNSSECGMLNFECT